MARFVVAHGAWSGGWSWKKMRAPLRALGHDLITPTYTGLGERFHLANPAIDLDTHIGDLLGVITYEDLSDLVLVGHSYGGMVATGVADQAADRIAQLVYLDAFVPQDGQSLFDLVIPAHREAMLDQAASNGDGWRITPPPLAPGLSPEDVAWMSPRRHDQPSKTFSQRIRLAGKVESLKRSYIYCRDKGPDDDFAGFAEKLRRDKAWRYYEMESDHIPNITMPEGLAARLDEAIRAA